MHKTDQPNWSGAGRVSGNFVKDQAIVELIATLPMAANDWIVIDHWDADLCAIGIARADRPRQLVYISTFDSFSGRYYYECEIPNGPCECDYITTASEEDVDFETLLDAITKHLRFNVGSIQFVPDIP